MVSIKSLLLLFFLPVSSFAFTLFANVTLNFANPKVPVYVVDDGSNSCANGNFTEQDLAGYVEEAVRYWNFVPTSNLVLEFKGIVNPGHTDFSNGELCNWDASYPPADCANATKVPQVTGIYVACSLNANANENFPQVGAYNTSILAATTMNNISGRNTIGAVVLMNTANAGVAIQNKSAAQITSIVAHELGHAVGLGHSENSAALMYEASIGVRESISQDDAWGISYLYPTKFDGCGLFGTIKNIDEDQGPINPSGLSFLIFIFAIALGRGVVTLLSYTRRFLFS